MKVSSKIGIVSIVMASAALGFLICKYKVSHLAGQLFKNKETTKSEVYEGNPSSYIRIHTPQDISLKRDSLINYLWKGRGFPNDKMPSKVEQNISDSHFTGMENLKQIDKMTIIMENSVQSIIYLFQPEESNNRLMIYHHGHVTGFDRGKEVIRFFLKQEFSVIGCSMPLCGMNNKSVVSTDFGSIQLLKHADFQFLDTKYFSSIHYFVEPVATALNYLDKNYKYESYSMIGISGGGWTTVFYAAIDDRIKNSYFVAGSAPIFLGTGFGEILNNSYLSYIELLIILIYIF